uniref:Microtubule-associated protein n=1 Tax=Nicotiana benthamiana TaxID=4100 RepID=E1U7Y5_NICBE|nr:microtubule-associated protein [Nicotiana benthamiana]
MAAIAIEAAVMFESSRRFGDLRGIRWRIDLGILPSSPSSTIDDLRRVTADSRRRYASLRRQLLIDPHIPKDGSNSPDPVIDNPLSQNPDSMWGRFFRNAELEKMVDQDLSRLYPEHGSYFQTPGCQAMLRRILLLWSLRHPEYGYRQGMHELLAPLLYVLQADTEQLSEVRNLYEDHFADKFDGFSFHENDLTYKFDFKKFSESVEDDNGSQKSPVKITNLSELDPKVQAVILLSDAYGAEGELGILLSEKFMEHDAYCMFDALMSGAGGAVAMAEFFSPLPYSNSHTGCPPIIEASASLYHLLSLVDSSLHSHLVELGVEPQYFALRWFRVLFGREFVLEDLLIIWDEIFACDNKKLEKPCENDTESSPGVLNSSRGAFISAFAVTMILHLRSSLLATENTTTCLQRLLNFPEDINLGRLIAKAKSLQLLAVDANNSAPLIDHTGIYGKNQSTVVRGHSHSVDLSSPKTPRGPVVPESYWEEKWRVLHKEEERKQNSAEKQVPNRRKGWSEKVRLRLTRTESAPTPSTVDNGKKAPKSVRRSLLNDLAQQLGADEDIEKLIDDENIEQEAPVDVVGQDCNDGNFTCTSEESCSTGSAASEQNSSIFSDPPSPISDANDHENRSERSSVASNFSADEIDADVNSGEASCTNLEVSPLPVSVPPQQTLLKSEESVDSGGKGPVGFKERKLLSGKFQWLWKFGRNGGEETSEKGIGDSTKACNCGNNPDSAADTSNNSGISKGESVDQNLMVSLRNLGQSMLENIQVIESLFQQDRDQVGTLENLSKNVIVGKGQVTAMAALKELRKISNLLSEM